MSAPKGNKYAVGNSGGGAPEGNQNAKGNSGGGPPKLNTNAVKHWGHCDPEKHYQRLDGDAREWADRQLGALVERYREVHGEEPDAEATARLEEIIAMRHMWWVTTAVTFEEGMVVERKGEPPRAHPAFDSSLRLSAKIRDEEEALGVNRLFSKEGGGEPYPQNETGDGGSEDESVGKDDGGGGGSGGWLSADIEYEVIIPERNVRTTESGDNEGPESGSP